MPAESAGRVPWADSDRRSRLPADWPKRREAVIARDNLQCQWRVAGVICGQPGTEVDHVVPGDDHRLENLQLLCANHHAVKSSREGNAARVRLHRSPEAHPALE